MRRPWLCGIVCCAVVAWTTGAYASPISVSGFANVFGAGHATAPGGGILPPEYDFVNSPSQVFTFSVAGSVGLTPGLGSYGGDGNPNNLPYYVLPGSDVLSAGGISGITDADAIGFLVGVFLDSTEPVDPSPVRLDFSNGMLGTGFTSLSPLIGQTFFIGDGLTETGSGTVQQFNAPATATRLFLGIADADGYHGAPGAYSDNFGSWDVTVSSIPEPSVLSLLGLLGLPVLLLRRYQRAPRNDRA
jgi:hypothetical protein